MQTHDPVVWIDRGATGLWFAEPLAEIRAETPEETPGALAALDRALAAGQYVAGYLTYEALRPSGRGAGDPETAGNGTPAAFRGPVLWFGAFRAPRALIAPPDGSGSYSLKKIINDSARGEFLAAVEQARAWIAEGRVYQINYTQTERFAFAGDPLALYLRLRRLQPARHAAFVRHADLSVLSCSPELFLKIEETLDGGALLETRPIKGTAGRGADATDDAARVQALGGDPKNRAENAMIVDLLRNDLGIHARAGSVRVGDLFAVETLPTLHQLYSVITARISPEKKNKFFSEIIPALFPCGSITGAPKLAARLFLRALESGPRGVYTGSVGYCGPGGGEFNVAIRTLEIAGTDALFGSGCGIVWDSRPVDEWGESQLKRAFLTPALDDFTVFTTMRQAGGRFVFGRDHLRRLRAAARQFDLPWSRAALRAALREPESSRVNGRSGHAPPAVDGDQRVRVALDRLGRFHVLRSPLESPLRRGFTRVRIAQAGERVDARDPFRRWKTSERELYDRLLRQARERGLEEYYFLNEAGALVETCTGNLLLFTHDGRWLTPAPATGALPGIYLRRLMRASGRIAYATLTPDDLGRARAVFVCNALRGLRRALPVPD